MPAYTVRGDLSLSVSRLSLGPLGAVTAIGFPMFGLGASLADWFQIDFGLFPLQISPEVDFLSPELRLTFAFTDNDAVVDAGFHMGALLPFGDGELWGVLFGFPLRVHGGDVFRFDTGLQATAYGVTGAGDPLFGLIRQSVVPSRVEAGVPLAATFNPVESFYLGVGSGFGAVDLTENGGIPPGETIFLPLSASTGVNIPTGSRGVLDLALDFDLPYFLIPAADEKVNTNFWQLSFTTSFHYTVP